MCSTSRPAAAGFAIDEVAARPLPGLVYPVKLAFTPDDAAVTYLHSPEGGLERQLLAFDLASNSRSAVVAPEGAGVTEDNLSLEEKLRRERRRELGLGVTSYAWSESGQTLLVPLGGGLWVQEGLGGQRRELVSGEHGPLLDPQLSPDGSQVAYVHDAELYVVPTAGGAPRQLTEGARGTGKLHGLAEYIAQEEMSRYHGYWWSPSGTHLAFTEIDETHIPRYRIVHQGKDATGPGAQEDHGYPFAGTSNAAVRLGVISHRGGKPVWMDLDMDGAARDPATGQPDIYLARVHWMPDGRLLAELQNRAQNRLELVAFDLASGARTVLLSERSDSWINLHDLFRPVASGAHAGGFLWGSERSGFMHLYLYDAGGAVVRALTEGAWMVTDLVGVDEEGGQVYVIATKDGATERHLYAVPLSGGAPVRLTSEPGVHDVVIDHAFERFVDTHSAIDQPPQVRVRRLSDGQVLATLHDPADPEQADPRLAALALTPPELVTVQTRDGVTLHGAVYRPDPEQPGCEAPYPLLVSVYGGPHVQRVSNAWSLTADLRSQHLRSQGYLVFKLDNRGSAYRGLAFESALHRDMGNVEVADQVDGVRWLVERGLADPERVGIFGWSYGGYMAAMALMRAPETFHVAVAGAPVTHWDGYDTHYTERYMGTPSDNPEGYAQSSVMQHVQAMQGTLLLVHGLIDENVHFRHTARLINALIAQRKDYRLLLFPDERHSPRGLEDRVYMEEQMSEFFADHLWTRSASPEPNEPNEE
ncbi:S9 family peptidase [Haliangium ochraceum]|nr:S9 family peptidase [Haliangium ochraceum]